MRIINKIDQHLEEYLSLILFSVMVLLVSAQIFSRFIFNFSLGWSEELARYTFIWFVYISISLAAKHNRHLRIEVGLNFLTKRFGNAVLHFTDLCWLSFNLLMVVYGAKMVQQLMNSIQVSAVTEINMGYVYLIIPIGFGLMSLRIIQNMWKRSNTTIGRKSNEEKMSISKNQENENYKLQKVQLKESVDK
ncbi:TRAP transporter small permease [Thalassobacillus devorans]|uniref:TRAP transporter small permease n=1 Tax=Thalassobacillus devorans TaxID=279813 RepID=UPI000A1CA06A|nr:TRAP transporter small permease [Thalassobacillus devorans]